MGIIFKQLSDYKIIVNNLLTEVNTLDNQTNKLKEKTINQALKITTLEEMHLQQQAQENYVTSYTIEKDDNATDLNTTDGNTQEEPITGYGLEHMPQF